MKKTLAFTLATMILISSCGNGEINTQTNEQGISAEKTQMLFNDLGFTVEQIVNDLDNFFDLPTTEHLKLKIGETENGISDDGQEYTWHSYVCNEDIEFNFKTAKGKEVVEDIIVKKKLTENETSNGIATAVMQSLLVIIDPNNYEKVTEELNIDNYNDVIHHSSESETYKYSFMNIGNEISFIVGSK